MSLAKSMATTIANVAVMALSTSIPILVSTSLARAVTTGFGFVDRCVCSVVGWMVAVLLDGGWRVDVMRGYPRVES